MTEPSLTALLSAIAEYDSRKPITTGDEPALWRLDGFSGDSLDALLIEARERGLLHAERRALDGVVVWERVLIRPSGLRFAGQWPPLGREALEGPWEVGRWGRRDHRVLKAIAARTGDPIRRPHSSVADSPDTRVPGLKMRDYWESALLLAPRDGSPCSATRHPMLPYLGQGACQAIEDGAVLAAALRAERDDPVAGLARYERTRRPRASRVVLAARERGVSNHLSSPIAAWRRDLTIAVRRRLGKDHEGRGAAWIPAYDATAPGVLSS